MDRRRRRLMTGFAAAAVAGLVPWPVLAAKKDKGPGKPPAPDLPVLEGGDYTRAAFEAYVGERFAIYSRNQSGWVETVELTEVLEGAGSEQLEVFWVRFSGPPGLGGDVYYLEHPEAGRFSLLIAPLGTDGAEGTYEAVFNLLR